MVNSWGTFIRKTVVFVFGSYIIVLWAIPWILSAIIRGSYPSDFKDLLIWFLFTPPILNLIFTIESRHNKKFFIANLLSLTASSLLSYFLYLLSQITLF